MKVSDLMLDKATGDACIEDAYVEYAVGRINVASAMFEESFKIAEVNGNPEFLCVQEAADAGQPTDTSSNTGIACEAVKQELVAFYDVIYNTAKKVKDSTDKDMKLLASVGKKNGISMRDGNYLTTFVKPLCNAVCNGKIQLNDKNFLKARYSIKMAENYGKGMGNLLSGYGISLDNVFGDSVVANVVGGSFAGRKRVDTLKNLASNLGTGAKLISFDKTVDKNSHYTDTIKAGDLEDFCTALYAINMISKAVVAAMGGASKKAAVGAVADLCANDTSKEKKISRVSTAINDDIKDWTSAVTGVTDAITKAFGDSAYTLVDAVK